MCFGVKNGGFPPFFIGLMSQGPDFCGVGRLFLRVCIDVVTIKIIVAMYVAHIVQIIKKFRGGGFVAARAAVFSFDALFISCAPV